MDDVRAKAKAFYNALDFDRPISFGVSDLFEDDRVLSESLYVKSLHGGDPTLDPE